jgi:hypothetical protein
MLPFSHYKPHLGGHAPGDLRDAFHVAVDAVGEWEAGPEPKVELRDKQVPVSRVFGLLWNCSDTLPGDERPGSYAAGARLLKALVAETQA